MQQRATYKAVQAKSRHPKRRQNTWLPYLFIAPAFVFYVLFLALPIVGTVVISLFTWTGISFNTLRFAGLSNYAALLQDPIFWQALLHNAYFIAGGMGSVVIVGLLLAVLLEQDLPGSSFFRGLFFVPTIMSLVVVGIVFSLILSPEFGLVNPLLRGLGLGRFAAAWLGNPSTALPTVIVVNTWQSFGLGMFLFVAGLKSIDAELYEAARIDGATPWQSFWRITMPLLWPVTTLVIILTSINILKLFDLVYVMTSGGPNYASEVLTTYMYSQGFEFNRMGYGSALAVVILLLTLLFTLLQAKVFSGERAGATPRPVQEDAAELS